MFTKTIALLAASLLSSVALAGNAYVTNDCSFPVYVQHVDQKGSSSLKTIAPRGVYMEAITTNPGAALKVWSTTDMSKPLSELDYTLTNTGNYQGLYYSLGGSGNSSPFTPYGYGIIPSNVGSLPSCQWDFCSKGVQNCANFAQVKVCPVNSDVNLFVCSG